MAELRIYGASDDLVELSGAINDEFSIYSDTWVGILRSPDGGALTVSATYTPVGVWTVGVGPLDEGQMLPDWPIRFEDGRENESSYSATLVIDIPAASTITEMSN